MNPWDVSENLKPYLQVYSSDDFSKDQLLRLLSLLF